MQPWQVTRAIILGLPPEMDCVRYSLFGNCVHQPFTKVLSTIKLVAQSIGLNDKLPRHSGPAVNHTNPGGMRPQQPPAGPSGTSERHHGAPGGQSGGGKPTKPPFCKYCKKVGHLVKDCTKRAAAGTKGDLEAKVNFRMEQLSAMGRTPSQPSAPGSVTWPPAPVPEGDAQLPVIRINVLRPSNSFLKDPC